MKIEVTPSAPNTEFTYPCILQSKSDPDFIIFCPEKEKHSIILSNGYDHILTGSYYGNFNEDLYNLFSGDIIISN